MPFPGRQTFCVLLLSFIYLFYSLPILVIEMYDVSILLIQNYFSVHKTKTKKPPRHTLVVSAESVFCTI